VRPKPHRPEPFLTSVPLPPLSARGIQSDPQYGDTTAGISAPIADEDVTPQPESDLLLGPIDDRPELTPARDQVAVKPNTTLLSPIQPSTGTSTTTAFMQNSTALQQDMSAQLAMMSGQLRRNAMHFSESLARDQTVMKDAEEKISQNYDTMKRERVRLRDHHGKSWGTTCLTVSSVLVVAIAFVMMYLLIRFTRR